MASPDKAALRPPAGWRLTLGTPVPLSARKSLLDKIEGELEFRTTVTMAGAPPAPPGEPMARGKPRTLLALSRCVHFQRRYHVRAFARVQALIELVHQIGLGERGDPCSAA